jgi:hypothetical protein
VAGEQIERRLAAMLIADVAGYSRLIGMDEVGTLARLNAHHAELITPKLTEHRGRIIRTTGDGLLVCHCRGCVALCRGDPTRDGATQCPDTARSADRIQDGGRRWRYRRGRQHPWRWDQRGSGWRRWQTRVAFACRAGCTKTRKAVCSGSASPLKISVSISSRTLRARCMFTAGFQLVRVAGHHDDGAALIERALNLNVNLARAWLYSAWVRIWLGEPERAIRHHQGDAVQPPRPLAVFDADGIRVRTLLLAGDDEAAFWASEAPRDHHTSNRHCACRRQATRSPDAVKGAGSHGSLAIGQIQFAPCQPEGSERHRSPNRASRSI